MHAHTHMHACMHTHTCHIHTDRKKINYLEGVEVNAFNPLKESTETEMFLICAFKNGDGSLHFSKGRNASLFDLFFLSLSFCQMRMSLLHSTI